MKNKDLFVKFLKRILNHEKKSPDYTHAMAYNNLAALYLSSGIFDKALKYTTEALNLIELEVSNKQLFVLLLMNIRFSARFLRSRNTNSKKNQD